MLCSIPVTTELLSTTFSSCNCVCVCVCLCVCTWAEQEVSVVFLCGDLPHEWGVQRCLVRITFQPRAFFFCYPLCFFSFSVDDGAPGMSTPPLHVITRGRISGLRPFLKLLVSVATLWSGGCDREIKLFWGMQHVLLFIDETKRRLNGTELRRGLKDGSGHLFLLPCVIIMFNLWLV